jgi:hypothetical protein
VEVIGDCAYGAGETRAEFAASGRTLVAKVPEIAESAGGVPPPAAHRTGREPLDSSGSCHPT